MKYIHLLYVPTMACNMQCRYCYLEDTTETEQQYNATETLDHAVKKLRAAGVTPFNISLHGGEVTTLTPEVFRKLIAYISDYYRKNAAEITGAGFRLGSPHIKTNLYGLDKHIDTVREFNVSVSGSLDLPFSLHDTFRVTRGGEKTLETILKNISLMAELPNRKKVSATIFREHALHTDEIIRDIRFLHRETCLDMNDFNFMIGFDYQSNGLLHALTQEEQVAFFEKLRDAFIGTELEPGLRNAWFAEFGPGYCTNCDNCGTKFFLLERNGDIYSCVRGQKHPELLYGNIYRDPVEKILANAEERIAALHKQAGFDPVCADCGYLSLCKTGCPFVKKLYGTPRSYTCLLQQKLYPFWGTEKDPDNTWSVFRYLQTMHPESAPAFAPPRIPNGVPPLQEIIRKDPGLQSLYDPEAFLLRVGETVYPMISQLLRISRETVYITPEDRVAVYIRKDILTAQCAYPVNNALYLQILSGDQVVYGEENRSKQRHIVNEMVYLGVLEASPSDREDFYCLDITQLLYRYHRFLSLSDANNLFVSTASLRDYHYSRQKNNAFYHMQAMDLPFQNTEFFYLTMDQEDGEHESTENL